VSEAYVGPGACGVTGRKGMAMRACNRTLASIRRERRERRQRERGGEPTRVRQVGGELRLALLRVHGGGGRLRLDAFQCVLQLAALQLQLRFVRRLHVQRLVRLLLFAVAHAPSSKNTNAHVHRQVRIFMHTTTSRGPCVSESGVRRAKVMIPRGASVMRSRVRRTRRMSPYRRCRVRTRICCLRWRF
jgi:hypothetical protein